jgi:hypothetical protein
MKLFYKTTLAGSLGLLLLVVVNACKKPTEDVNLIINTSLLSKAPALIQFINANPNSTTNLPASFAVTISGTGANLVQVDGGGTNFTAVNGLLPLTLTKNANPSPNNPVTYHIYASVPGFAPVSKTITVTGTKASAPVIALVEYANPALGTSAVARQTALTAGTSAAMSLNILVSAGNTEAASITIPAGTQLLDANKTVINSTQLKSNVVYFGTGNTASLSAFPGGFNPENTIGPNGQPIPEGTTFVTAGLLSINMMAGATAVKNFSKPVILSMEINSTLVNPQTKQLVKAGDSIPIWSLNEETGQWKYETTADIFRNGNGKLAVSFPITHLSGWSANWYGATCTSTLNVTLRIPNTTQELAGDYLISLTTANEQAVSTFTTSQIQDGFTTVLSDYPADAGDLKLIVYTRSGNTLTKLGETSAFSPCSKGTVEVTLGTQTVEDLVKTHIKVTAKCTTQQVVAYPSAWVTLKDATTGQTTNIYMTDGLATANLINGHSYSINTTYAGKSYKSAAFKLDKAAGVTIPAVNGLSGTTSYDSSTNTINVDATFTLTNCGS